MHHIISQHRQHTIWLISLQNIRHTEQTRRQPENIGTSGNWQTEMTNGISIVRMQNNFNNYANTTCDWKYHTNGSLDSTQKSTT